MISVEVKANGQRLFIQSAQRIESLKHGKRIYKYKLDNGQIIKHRFLDGANVLAAKILKEYKTDD